MKSAFDDDEMTADELRSAISGWKYHNALDKLEAAYKGACTGPTLMIDEAQRRSKSIQADWDRYDEMDADDRESLQAYSDGLGEDMSAGIASLSLVREAFIISLFHFWEKMAKDIGGAPACDKDGRYDHNKALGHFKRLGFKVLPTELTILKYAAEVAKHSLGPSATKLVAMRAGMFVNGTDKENAHYDRLMIMPHHVELAFIAVRTSGPPRGRLVL